MADQDFNIKVVTTADTTGINQIDAGLDKIAKRQAEAEAKWARSPINPKNQTGGGIVGLGGGPSGPTPPSGGGNAGITGTAIGVGTIVTLLTAAVDKWKAFNDEQDRWVDGMIKAQDKSRELGLSVADMLDAMKSAERIEFEPLQVSFDRLKQKVIELKTELHSAFETGAYEDAKRYASQLAVVESQLNRVTNAIERQSAAEQKSATDRAKALEKKLSDDREFNEQAYGSASPQAKAILRNEEAFRRTQDPAFQRAAEAIRRGATPDQLAEADQLAKALNPPEPRPGRKAGIGESQELVDQIERQRIAAENAQRRTNEPGGETGTGGQSMVGNSEVIKAIDLLGQKFDQYWR